MLRITGKCPFIDLGELFSAFFKQNFVIDAVEGTNTLKMKEILIGFIQNE